MISALTFTVVISTRNRGPMIEPAIASLMALNHPSFEVVVIDQSSDSLTQEAVDRLSGGDLRVRYARSDQMGVARGRNDGLFLSRADVIAFTDDDCVVDPGWLSAIEAEMADPAIAGVFGRVLPDQAAVRTGIDLAVKDSQRRVEYAGKTIPWYIGHGANMAFRRADLIAVGGFDELLGPGGPLPSHEDGDLLYRLLASGRRVVFSPRSLVYHRQWRDWSERARTERAYGVGAGGQFTKYIRCRDSYGFRLFATWTWQLGVRRIGAGMLKWRSAKVMYLGYVQLVYPWIGVWRSLRYPVDPKRVVYAVDSVRDRLHVGLRYGAAIDSTPKSSTEAPHPVEHR